MNLTCLSYLMHTQKHEEIYLFLSIFLISITSKVQSSVSVKSKCIFHIVNAHHGRNLILTAASTPAVPARDINISNWFTKLFFFFFISKIISAFSNHFSNRSVMHSDRTIFSGRLILTSCGRAACDLVKI